MVRSEDEPCLRIPSSYSIVSTGYRGCMDVLSDVIAVMRTGQARSAQVTWHAPWAQQFASVPGSAGFQIILQGSCWLIQPHTNPVPLSAGDVLFLPHGRGHTLAGSPSTPPTAPACGLNEPHIHQRYATGTVGAPTGTDPASAQTRSCPHYSIPCCCTSCAACSTSSPHPGRPPAGQRHSTTLPPTPHCRPYTAPLRGRGPSRCSLPRPGYLGRRSLAVSPPSSVNRH